MTPADRAYDALVLDHAGVLPDRLPEPASATGLLAVALAVRAAGVRTALLSNADGPPAGAAALFDVVLVSGRTGLRKPDPRAYALAADRLGVAPARCVVVDDVPANVRGAVSTGMTGVLHRGDDTTVAELAVLLGLSQGDSV